MSNTLTVDLTFTESFRKKTDPDTWKTIISECLNDVTDELLKECKEECPVDTGNLRDGHEANKPDGFEKGITNNVEYAPYVIYGTMYRDANDYPSRAVEKVQNNNTMEESFKKRVKQKGIDTN